MVLAAALARASQAGLPITGRAAAPLLAFTEKLSVKNRGAGFPPTGGPASDTELQQAITAIAAWPRMLPKYFGDATNLCQHRGAGLRRPVRQGVFVLQRLCVRFTLLRSFMSSST